MRVTLPVKAKTVCPRRVGACKVRVHGLVLSLVAAHIVRACCTAARSVWPSAGGHGSHMAGSRHQARRRRVGDERVHRAVHEVPQIATLAQTTAIPVFPDCVTPSDGTRPKFLLDPKYQEPVEKRILRIVETDIDGSLAFTKATGDKDRATVASFSSHLGQR